MSFFIGLSKSPAVPVVSRDTFRRPSAPPLSSSRSFFFPSRPKLNTLESERLNLSAITRSFPSSSIKARLGRFYLSFSFYPATASDVREEADIQESMEANISAESVTARVCVSVDGNSRREPPTVLRRMDGRDEEARKGKRKRGDREKRDTERMKDRGRDRGIKELNRAQGERCREAVAYFPSIASAAFRLSLMARLAERDQHSAPLHSFLAHPRRPRRTSSTY